jgi:glutamate 5-kinase
VIPILNENDAVATAEIKFGDNDSLSAQIAVMMRAERLVLLTDVDGLYDADPKTHSRARLIPEVESIAPGVFAKVDRTAKSAVGTGGMYSKLLAAKLAVEANIVTHLVRGDSPRNLLLLAAGESIGTRIGKSTRPSGTAPKSVRKPKAPPTRLSKTRSRKATR